MAEIKGTNVAAPIVPFTTDDIFATHEAQYGKGGYRSVQRYEDLAKIPKARLEDGMMAYVVEDTNGVGTYQYFKGKWVRSRVGGGIPVVNQEIIDSMGLDPKKDEYISIPSIDKDLYGKVEENNYKTTVNGTYVDILFQAIRQLQNEVARLRNSFKLGIESYSGTTTAMTTMVDEYSEIPEEEPIWAVDEDGLSDLGVDEMGEGHTLISDKGSIEVVVDQATTNTYLKIKGDASWTAPDEVKLVPDSKIYMYLTMSGRKAVLNLCAFDATLEDFLKDREFSIDLHKIELPKVSERDVYNILFVISRTQQLLDGDGNYYGKNFLWASFSDPDTGQVLGEGYLTPDNTRILKENPVYMPENDRLNFVKVNFTGDTTLSKFKFYSKYQDLSHNIIGTRPTDEDYKYKVAHLTIRAVKNQAELVAVHQQLLNNELIWNEETSKLWIKSNNKLVAIGSASSGGDVPGGGGEESGMTKEEMLQALGEMGIIKESNGDLSLNNVALGDITFIHTGTGCRYKYDIDSEGNLHATPLPDVKRTFDYRIKNDVNVNIGTGGVRGFIGQLRASEAKMSKSADVGIYSDRLKIGSLYNPLKTDKIHGCTHSFIELENTSDEDFALKGCYIHYTWPGTEKQEISHLALDGVIPAGGTYLIRGARYAEDDDVNAFIKVKTFDQEWYHEGKLLTFEVDNTQTYIAEQGYGFCLTFGNNFNSSPLTPKTALVRSSKAGDSDTSSGITLTDSNLATFPYYLNQYFIDGIYVYKAVSSSDGTGYWANYTLGIIENSLYRNMFELDPAKQAFQAFTTKDSSRARWAKPTDCMILDLSKEFITFPHTDEPYAIANYTPKASFEKRNVCTGKTDLDRDKPNMVTCSFGIDIYKTRCFNWISYGYFDEYVWFRKKSENTWSKGYMSYVPVHKISISKLTEQRGGSGGELTGYTMNFNVDDIGFLTGTSLSEYTELTDNKHNPLISGLKITFSSGTYSASISVADYSKVSLGKECILHVTKDDLEDRASHKRFFSPEVTNGIYSRLSGRFPGNGSFFTSHKVILDITDSTVVSPTEYVYVVGRADKNGKPDPKHTSEEMSFTLYPTNYKTRIYQITDQQGFHWVEYQVWAASAKKIAAKIKEDQGKANIIPIIVNTGDVTQNGTRINEWLDYYKGGYPLFNHLEQANVVGNNDLCNTDTSILGTGDDVGKSNSYYFHLFNCYEVDEKIFTPLIKNISKPNTPPKCVPSLYYLDSNTDRFLFINSEITEVNCKDWFGLVHNGKTVNAYTGYQIDEAANGSYVKIDGFTTIYTMIWRILNDAKTKKKPIIASMHELPFTVITNESLLNTAKKVNRSLSNSGALVGSHLNMISKNEVSAETKTPKGLNWFSRLLEYFGVKLCIGGHKHTYTCSYPLRENYLYGPDGRTSSQTKPMDMPETLETDTANFISGSTDLSKFPLTRRAALPNRVDEGFYPYTAVPDLTGGVVYFMCQATGYKLTSNKELPSQNQAYTWILPKTTTKFNNSNNTYKDKPSAEQKYPMFSVVDVNNGSYSLKLARITNIMVGGVFNQYTFSTGEMDLQWLIKNPSNNFGTWSNEESALTTLKDSDWL